MIYGWNAVASWPWKDSSGMILYAGILDKEWVLDFLNNQNRGYKYTYNGTTFKWGKSDGREAKPATEERLLLPYPLNEATMNPLLREEPVHFDIAEE